MKKYLLIVSVAFSLLLASCTAGSSVSGGGGGSSSLSVTTKTASDITDHGFVSGGTLKNVGTQDILSFGVCISRTANPSFNDLVNSEVIPAAYLNGDEFTCYVESCSAGTVYYYRAYVVYGDEDDPQIKQGSIKQVKTTGSSSQIIVTTYQGYIGYYYGYYLQVEGNVTAVSDSPVINEKGFCYSKNNHQPNINDNKYICGSGYGGFSARIENLSYMSTYYYCAYAKYNGNLVEYGTVYHASTDSKTGSYH